MYVCMYVWVNIKHHTNIKQTNIKVNKIKKNNKSNPFFPHVHYFCPVSYALSNRL